MEESVAPLIPGAVAAGWPVRLNWEVKATREKQTRGGGGGNFSPVANRGTASQERAHPFLARIVQPIVRMPATSRAVSFLAIPERGRPSRLRPG